MEKIQEIRKQESKWMLVVFLALIAAAAIATVVIVKLTIVAVMALYRSCVEYRAQFGIYGFTLGGEMFVYPMIVLAGAYLVKKSFEGCFILLDKFLTHYDEKVKAIRETCNIIRKSSAVTHVIDVEDNKCVGVYYKGNDRKIHYRNI